MRVCYLLGPLVVSCNLLMIFTTNYVAVEKTLLREAESFSKVTELIISGYITSTHNRNFCMAQCSMNVTHLNPSNLQKDPETLGKERKRFSAVRCDHSLRGCGWGEGSALSRCLEIGRTTSRF